MKRIMIIGSGGAGKSTFSRQLGEILNIELIHLDSLYWKPGWVETPKAEWKAITDKLIEKEEWIIDGNYGGTMEARLQRADTIIFMDFSNVSCLWRAMKRRVQYAGRVRPDMGNGCPEKIDWGFITWIWNFPKLIRPGILTRINQYSTDKEVIILHDSKEVKRFLQSLVPASDNKRSGM